MAVTRFFDIDADAGAALPILAIFGVSPEAPLHAFYSLRSVSPAICRYFGLRYALLYCR